MGRYVGRLVFLGQVMSSHHSDQMSQRSKVYRVALCMSKSKGHSLSDSVTRSPIELFWTAKNISVTKACIDAYDFVVINTQEKRGR